jgi:mRNA-degrading endonuclease YafQ of YafQ-DinJ toxin-antitoxin module
MGKLLKEIKNLRPTKEQVKDKPAFYAFGYVDAINAVLELLRNSKKYMCQCKSPEGLGTYDGVKECNICKGTILHY